MGEIKNQWCTYGMISPWGIGRVVEDVSSQTVVIQYTEGQIYSPEYWDANYVERFPSLLKAAEFYSEAKGEPLSLVLSTHVGVRFAEALKEEMAAKKSLLNCLSTIRDSKK